MIVVEGFLKAYDHDLTGYVILFQKKKIWGSGPEFPYMGILAEKHKNHDNLGLEQN